MAVRPEHLAPPELFYNEAEARKYTYNSRIMDIQVQMCERAVELLALPDERCLLLDIGCGSGLSGSVLDDNGHCWFGIDISTSMLRIAKERDVNGELLLSDMGQGMPFRAGSFDGIVSISALQWLCNVDSNAHSLHKRLHTFFSTLFACLSSNARAVFQFYPENDKQVETMTAAACKAGFNGGVIIDYPNSKKARKFFLVLMTGGLRALPKALDGNPNAVNQDRSYRKPQKQKTEDNRFKCKRTWIMKKKEKMKRQGKKVKADSKYSGRKRSCKF